jgi:hypothetical protein
MNTVYFDWSMQRGLSVLFNDEDTVRVYPNIERLLDSLTTQTTLVSEATFESFRIDKRQALIDTVHRRGHEWLTFSGRRTPRARKALELEKSDDNDVRAIRYVATYERAGLRPASVADSTDPRVAKREAANGELMTLRRNWISIDAPRVQSGFKIIRQKDIYADEVIAQLPTFSTLDDVKRRAMGIKDGKEYSKVLVAAAAIATKYSDNRTDFEFLAGLYSNGYPSQIRSDFHHWTFRFAKARGATMTEFRKSCRWLYHQLTPLRDVL